MALAKVHALLSLITNVRNIKNLSELGAKNSACIVKASHGTRQNMSTQRLTTLLGWLADPNPAIRISALREFAKLGSQALPAAPKIRECLSDAGQTSSTSGDGGSMLEKVTTHFSYVRCHAVLALAKIDPVGSAEAVAPVVVEALSLLSYQEDPLSAAITTHPFTWNPYDLLPFGVAIEEALENVNSPQIREAATELLAVLRRIRSRKPPS
jgi:vesicle coat complex subunit